MQAESENYNKCISICQEAIKIGIEKETDFKLLTSNPFVMMGKAYRKSGDLKNAKITYENALKETTKLQKSKVQLELKKIEKMKKLEIELDNEYVLATPGGKAFTS